MSYRDEEMYKNISWAEKYEGLITLFAIHAVFFVILGFLYLSMAINSSVNDFSTTVLPYFSLSPHVLGSFSYFWTIVLYPFGVYSVWPFVGTMVSLWFFGSILQDLSGKRKLMPIYIYSTLISGLFFVCVSFFLKINLNMALIGPQVPLLAISFASATISPKYKMFPFVLGGIPVWVVTSFFAVLNFKYAFSQGVPTIVAYIIGCLVGYGYIWLIRTKGYDIGAWMHEVISYISTAFNPQNQRYQRKKNLSKYTANDFYTAHYHTTKKKGNDVEIFTREEQLNMILDKMNLKGGYHSLSDEEKKFLETYY